MTTSDYLNQLEQDREDLVDNLEAKGITGLSGDETFTELVPQVLNIPSGSGGLDWSAIGYSGTPQSVIDGYNYAKQIYDNWDSSQTSMFQKFYYDYELIYMPLVDTSNATQTSYMFNYAYSLTDVPSIDVSNSVDMRYMFGRCYNLKKVASLNTESATMMGYMFSYCLTLKDAPMLDTKNVEQMNYMFQECTSLQNVPEYNTSKIKTMQGMFSSVSNLTDTSLNNILKMCITATSTYTKTKTLAYMGFTSSSYPASRIQALPSYQDFISEGWTIGY